nr:LUD domain-containing protein [Archaeoglobus neptunius]
MNKAFKILRERQRRNLEKYPEIKEIAKKIRVVREKSVGNEELLEKTVENLKRRGFTVKRAEDRVEALSIISELLEGEKVIVKSKSNLSKEIGLREELEKLGFDVVETDVGDRLIQILNEHPSHPTGPAVHLSVKLISEKLSEYFGFPIPPDAGRIVELLREDIQRHVKIANVGITGANAITKEGAAVLLHNEGNIFEVMHRPKRWIILAGIEKVYPSVEDAIMAAKLQSFYATGEILPSFVEIVSGTAKTADIEKKLLKSGSPEEVILILIDNGRSRIANSEFREVLYCLGCGNCVANCPSHSVHGKKFTGGRFALIDALYGRKDVLKLCLSCRRCKKNCPMEIDIPKMISSLRDGNEIVNFLISHAIWLNERIKLEILKYLLK